jgi:hypothetical protein
MVNICRTVGRSQFLLIPPQPDVFRRILPQRLGRPSFKAPTPPLTCAKTRCLLRVGFRYEGETRWVMATVKPDSGRIHQERVGRLLTMRQLAHLAGVDVMTVCRAERGRNVSTSTIHKLAHALRIRASVLVGEEL